MDGSGRISKRNRQFLKPIKTYGELLGGKPDYASVERQKECRQVARRTLLESTMTSNPGCSSGSAQGDGLAATEQHAQRDKVLAGDKSVSCPETNTDESPSVIGGSRVVVTGRKTIDARSPLVEEVSQSEGPRSRPVCERKKPDFLVVGKVKDPRFNRPTGH